MPVRGTEAEVRDVRYAARLGREARRRVARALPIVAVGCGLRPGEVFALHGADVDRTAGVLLVRRRFTGGQVKAGTKTGAEREVLAR